MSSSKTTTNNSTTTTTPTNPQWVTDSSQGLTNQIMNLLSQSPSSFVAGPSPLQTTQFDLAGGLGQQGAGWLTQAANLANGAGGANTALYGGYNPAMMSAATIGGPSLASTTDAQAQTAYGGIGNYFNPFQSQVANTTLQQLNQANQMALNDVGSGAILAGQYGGSRQGVAQGLTNSQFQQNAANALANLNLQGFNTALGASNNDAERAQQVSLANAAAANAASQFNASSQNSNALNQAQMIQQAAASNQAANNNAWQYNAGVYNAGNQFNASQADNAANRQLQGGQILGGLGSTGLNYLSSSGGTQQALNQALASAPLSVLQQLAGSYGSLPLSLFHGSTATTNGTQKETSSDPFQTAVRIASVAAAPFTGGASLAAAGLSDFKGLFPS
ncbi:MAG TPA: hypothetical protein VL358_01090 [Caulobacteraceae bacterium]|jgi:hypothetical protein|nr:hypothetical protein [Caulobacteraceae bacterium]